MIICLDFVLYEFLWAAKCSPKIQNSCFLYFEGPITRKIYKTEVDQNQKYILCVSVNKDTKFHSDIFLRCKATKWQICYNLLQTPNIKIQANLKGT